MKHSVASFLITILLFLLSVGAKAQDIEWHPVDTVGGSDVNSLTISTNNRIYAISNVSGSTPASYLFRYNDSPYHWTETILPAYSLRSFQVSGNALVYISYFSGQVSLSLSSDLGDTWKDVSFIGNFGTSNILSFTLAKDNSIVLTTNSPHYLMRTTDLGITWDTLVGKSPNLALGVSKNVIYITEYEGTHVVAAQTKDGGKSWGMMPLVPSDTVGYISQLVYQNGLLYALLSSGKLYWGRDTLYACKTPIPTYYLQEILVDKNNNIYGMRSDTLLYRSTDEGNSWDSIRAPYLEILCADSSGGLVATTSSSTLTSSDQGTHWTEIGTSRRIKPLHITAGRKPYLFCDSLLALSRSSDNGHSWAAVHIPGMQELQALHITTNGDLICAIKDTSRDVKLIISFDDGDTWSPLPVPPDQPIYNIFYIITSNNDGDLFALDLTENLYILEHGSGNWIKSTIAGIGSSTFSLAAGDSGIVYSGAAFGKVFRSDSNGRSFKQLTDIGTNATVTHIAIIQNGTVYLGTDSAGVLRSRDKGKTWESVNTGLPGKNIIALACDPSDGLYAATQKGVYYLYKYDDVWQQANNGLFDSNIFSMTMRAGSDLFVSTSQFGIFHAALTPSSVRKSEITNQLSLLVEKDISGSQAKALFTLPQAENVEIDLLDALGRTIERLASGNFSAGEQTVSFSANTLASGVYFVRLTAGNAKAVAPFIR